MSALIRAQWLYKQLLRAPKQLRILDGSWHLPSENRDPKKEFESIRIPGAKFFDIEECTDKGSSFEHMMPHKEDFANYVKSLGIGNDNHVVVYDNNVKFGMFSAPRVWWTFRAFGHENVSVLDGGLPKWLAEGYPTESGPADAEEGGEWEHKSLSAFTFSGGLYQTAFRTSETAKKKPLWGSHIDKRTIMHSGNRFENYWTVSNFLQSWNHYENNKLVKFKSNIAKCMPYPMQGFVLLDLILVFASRWRTVFPPNITWLIDIDWYRLLLMIDFIDLTCRVSPYAKECFVCTSRWCTLQGSIQQGHVCWFWVCKKHIQEPDWSSGCWCKIYREVPWHWHWAKTWISSWPHPTFQKSPLCITSRSRRIEANFPRSWHWFGQAAGHNLWLWYYCMHSCTCCTLEWKDRHQGLRWFLDRMGSPCASRNDSQRRRGMIGPENQNCDCNFEIFIRL